MSRYLVEYLGSFCTPNFILPWCTENCHSTVITTSESFCRVIKWSYSLSFVIQVSRFFFEIILGKWGYFQLSAIMKILLDYVDTSNWHLQGVMYEIIKNIQTKFINFSKAHLILLFRHVSEIPIHSFKKISLSSSFKSILYSLCRMPFHLLVFQNFLNTYLNIMHFVRKWRKTTHFQLFLVLCHIAAFKREFLKIYN